MTLRISVVTLDTVAVSTLDTATLVTNNVRLGLIEKLELFVVAKRLSIFFYYLCLAI